MQTITVLNTANPHRAESRRAKAFTAACAAKTVEDYKASPFAKPKYLQRWQAMGLIKLEGEADVPAKAVPAKASGIAAKLAKAEKAVK